MEYIKKDVTTVKRGIIAHGVNCKGVMGSGIAKALRDKWPAVFEHYSTWPASPDLLGRTQFVPINANVWVANCFTQIAYGRDPNVKYASAHAIAKALLPVFQLAAEEEKPLYLPRIGCGLGGLSWDLEVRQIVVELQERFQVELYICDI